MAGEWAANGYTFKPQLTTQGTNDKADFDTSQDQVDAALKSLSDGMATAQGDITNIEGDVTNLQGDVTNLQAEVTEVEQNITNIEQIINNNPGTLSVGTYLASGGTVAWVSGLTFRVGITDYYINGTHYTSAEQEVTLDAADGSNDRIDAIVLDASGTLGKITGTPASSPARPSVDPLTYVEVTFVYVPTGATTPANITNENIYLEGAEWTCTPSAVRIVVDSANNPRTGSKCIEATDAIGGDYLTAVKSSTLVLSNYNNVILYLRLKNQLDIWALGLTCLNGSTTLGSTVQIGQNTPGFDPSNITSYQQIVIPVSVFGIAAGTLIDTIRIDVQALLSTAGFYLDDWFLQAGTPSGNAELLYMGAWSNAVYYNQSNIVLYNGSTWLCLTANAAQTPAPSSTYWTALGLAQLDPAIPDHGYSDLFFSATAGENLALGDVCYLKSDGKYWKAQADAEATMPGMVMATAAISADATGVFLQKGFIRDDSGWGGALTVGGLLYVSEATAGLATQTAPSTTTNQVQVIGYAYAARVVWFDPCPILVEVP